MTTLNLESLVLPNVSVNGVNNVVKTGSDRLGSRLASGPWTPAFPFRRMQPQDYSMPEHLIDAQASRAGRPERLAAVPGSRWPRPATPKPCWRPLTASKRGFGTRTTRLSTRGAGA